MGPATSQSKAQVESGENEPLTINHPKFHNLKVVSAPTEEDEGVIEIVVPLPSENQFKKWVKRVSELTESENIFLPLRQRFEKTEFCGSGGITTIAYKYYPYLLSDEVINRCNMEGKFFEEAELWYLVYSIIQAGGAFHSAGIKIGDIRPQNVFISPEGQVRVATQFTWPGEQTNYLKTVFEKETTYLSPEELKDINYGKLEQPTNFAANESFSIGLTCLDAATLTDSTKLYEPNNKFNYHKLEQRILALEKSRNYSPALILLIKGLCQVEEEKRITCQELAKWLIQYEAFIIELQEFTVKELPDKLSRLNPEKPRDSRAQQPQPQQHSYLQYQSQIPSNPPVSGNYISAPINRSQIKYTQQNIIKPGYPGQQYITQSSYQYGYDQYNPNMTYISNPSAINPNQRAQNISQTSNNNPSIITFQKDPTPKSILGDNSVNSQVRNPASINLQQIDEQLQMSRKLFPS